MRYFILAALLLTGCDSRMAEIYRTAKSKPGYQVCYTVYDSEYGGRYCTYYDLLIRPPIIEEDKSK